MTKQEFLQQVKFATPTAFILRGLPGSGKSTLVGDIANRTYRSYQVCSADHYWIQKDGSYKFDLTQVPKNHHQCLRRFINDLSQCSTHSVFLDNTNTSLKEFGYCVQIAEAYDYKTVLITLNCSVETSMKRNVHNVPEKTIKGMFKRLNDLDNSLKLNAFCREHNIEHFVIDGE
jgi:predicted kinase